MGLRFQAAMTLSTVRAGAMSYSSMNQICSAPWGRLKHFLLNGGGTDSKTHRIWEVNEYGSVGVGTINESLPYCQSSGSFLLIDTVFSLHFDKSFPCLCLANSTASSGQTLLSLEGREPDSGFCVTVDYTELRGVELIFLQNFFYAYNSTQCHHKD